MSVWVEMSMFGSFLGFQSVTLHVSVWVEICELSRRREGIHVTLHVSVWVEIAVDEYKTVFWAVTLHVSVWVEINHSTLWKLSTLSRSTWACELKFLAPLVPFPFCSHAPRERVSWNFRWMEYLLSTNRHAPRERVSWNFLNTSFWREKCVTLHVSVWVEITTSLCCAYVVYVTLHVSVWVEIHCKIIVSALSTSSRSTWACELK